MIDATNQLEKNVLNTLFTSAGEMGARIQAFDWSTTPLGSIDTWSPSLQIALQILLLSKFPMQILWGADYIQFYNDAYIPIAGNKHPTALGQRGEDCWREVWEFAGPLLDQVMTTGVATWSEDQLLILNRHGYPEEGYFTFSYTPVWEKAGTVGGVFIAVTETTQKILSEQRERALRLEAQAAKESAEQANKLKDQFLAVLSHELRSPLNPILGWTTLLLNRQLDNATTRRALESIERNARLQVQLIDDLLDVSRILSNKLVLDRMPISFLPVIEDALETVQSKAKAKSIRLQTHLDPSALHILADANRLKQVVWNLLSNAVKFTPQGGQITIELEYGEGIAILHIIDTGKGISPEFLPHVFDRFRQESTLTTRLFGGLGLGLAIAKQIVDLHGGTLQASSPGEGLGATFTVILPLTASPSSDMTIRGTGGLEPSLTNLEVLVVEDDPDNREMITATLERYGARVKAVPSAATAIHILSDWLPDVLISDIGMAEMDGYHLMRHLRTAPRTQQLPAIALTAYVGEIDRQQALAAGFQAHLSKPMEPTQLVATILTVVHRHG